MSIINYQLSIHKTGVDLIMKLLIAGLVTELEPKYDYTKRLAEPFIYEGDRPADISLKITDEYYDDLRRRAVPSASDGELENFAFSTLFNRRAIPFKTMLVHSSAIVCDGKAYLFSADSGVGKSTHTRLWLKAFGDKVHILNDDKPVVRLDGEQVIVCGTPFDGGSGIAVGGNYPLGAIIFIERGERNFFRVPDNKEIIRRLYFQTAHMVSAQTADKMLGNFSLLLSMAKCYVFSCNTDISAAHTAYDFLISNNNG